MSDTPDNMLAISAILPDALMAAGHQANAYASTNVFAEYRQRVAANTLRRQAADLLLFERYLGEAGVRVTDLATQPDPWRGMTWGIVAGFIRWMLKQGYAVGTVNVRLATIKTYCSLAHQAGTISADDYTAIKTVKGYGHRQATKVDEKREVKRTGTKKAQSISLTKEQADLLKHQPDTPQGRRDTLLMCLLLDHGLRCGEVALLAVTDFDLKTRVFKFYRPKVDKVQTHRLTADTLAAALLYFTYDAPLAGRLLLGSRKSGRLEGSMSGRAINDRVQTLGQAIGVQNLSPHDCRHYWATRAAQQGTDPFVLQEAGGWNSLAMPRRYVEQAKIANEGVKL